MIRSEISVLATRRIDPTLITLAADASIDISVTEFISIHIKHDEETKKRANRQPSEVVVFTSKNAVEAAATLVNEEYKNKWKRIYAIEGSTSAHARSLFAHTSVKTAADAMSLGRLIVNSERSGTVTFFCGNRRRNDLPLILHEAGFEIDEQQVYENILSPAVVHQNFDGVMFFSPSAVQSFFSVNSPGHHVVCFSIGHTTTEELKRRGSYKIITANQSSESSMVDSVINYYRSNN